MIYPRFLIILLWIIPGSINSQSVIDSLTSQLNQVQHDTTRLDLLNKLIFETSFVNPEKAIEYGDEAMEFGKEINDPGRRADTYNGMGVAYYLQGNFLQSINSFLEALKGYETVGNKTKAANVMNNIGITYDEIGNYNKAKEYYLESLESYDGLDKPYAIASIFNNLGTAFEALKQYDSAKVYFNQSLEIALENNMQDKLADAYLNLGNIANKNNDNKIAIQYLDKALAIDLSNNNQSGLVETYAGLSQSWLKEKNYSKAFGYIQKANEINEDLNMPNHTARILKLISEYYEATNDYDKSLQKLKEYNKIHDSLFTLETSRQIEDLLIQYEAEKKAREISNLIEKNRLKDADLKYQKTKSSLMLIISLLAILGTGLIWVNSRMKTRANKMLNKKSQKIQEQNILLEEHTRHLKQLDQEKDKFLSLVAHDLKSPLTKIQGLTNLIKASGSLNEEQNGYISLMGRISYDARSLIENILELSLLESGKLVIQTEKIKIHEMLGNIIEEYQDIANQKKISIVFHPKDEFTAITNLELSKRVVDNLLSNAIKFSPNGKTVTIDCRKEEADLFQISIKDQGPGIKQQEKENLFKKYQKLSAKPTAGESSTGLGLAIVKLLVDYLEGSVEVITVENQGSTFITRFPLKLETKNNIPS